jgi:hypothetical protein
VYAFNAVEVVVKRLDKFKFNLKRIQVMRLGLFTGELEEGRVCESDWRHWIRLLKLHVRGVVLRVVHLCVEKC